MTVRRVAVPVLIAVLLAGCGSAATPHTSSTSTATRPVQAQAPAAPRVVQLRLELPLVGLSDAPTVSYATTSGEPTVRGQVQPAGATVYMLAPDGTRTAVNPNTTGTFTVHPKLRPGSNDFQFTAAQIGARSHTANLAVSWHGPAADAMQRKIDADPAKYMAPASAGLNRKLPPLGDIPAIAAGGAAAAKFALNPILGGPPPLTGGPGKWIPGFELTEYYPALEAWFVGAPTPAPGLASQHRIDWLYSAHGLSMEGDGIGLDGRQYHVASVGSGGWLTAGGGNAQFGGGGNAPYWRTGGYWRTAGGALTFPLAAGGWSNGAGVKYVPPPGITFAPGPSRPLAYLRSVAVDPSVIPLGSHIYIPAYASINGGWFQADDTGGAIVGRHIDVFRPPPANPNDTGNFATGETVYVVPPGVAIP